MKFCFNRLIGHIPKILETPSDNWISYRDEIKTIYTYLFSDK
jgi:endonuclease IV